MLEDHPDKFMGDARSPLKNTGVLLTDDDFMTAPWPFIAHATDADGMGGYGGMVPQWQLVLRISLVPCGTAGGVEI